MSLIYTPAGVVNTERQRVELPKPYIKALGDFADDSGLLNLGLHCSICKQDLRGANGLGDARLTMECGCRVFVGANPHAGH